MSTYPYGWCPYCSTEWQRAYHAMAQCPAVESIELWADGTPKRVVLRDPTRHDPPPPESMAP